MLVLVNSYPKKLFNYPGKKADFIDYLQNGSYSPTLAGMDSRISPALYNELRSGTPLTHTTRGDFTCAKIQGALNHRSTPITPKDCHNCQILTIHGAKGLEADTVYLHTGITPRIKENLVIPGEESAAESRVWYVGITRAKDWLYVIRDAGHNYQLPEAAV
jgi:hypothetical protein